MWRDGRDWGDAVTNQEMPQMTGNHQKPGPAFCKQVTLINRRISVAEFLLGPPSDKTKQNLRVSALEESWVDAGRMAAPPSWVYSHSSCMCMSEALGRGFEEGQLIFSILRGLAGNQNLILLHKKNMLLWLRSQTLEIVDIEHAPGTS